MHISDKLGQYNQATAAGGDKVTGKKGVENLVSSVKSLTKGNIFEGTVSSMKNGRVTLALSNGTQLSARMDGKVALSVGQSMFFQVKSNDGSQIAIRPFVVDGNGVNFTLMQALGQAGLPVESGYLSMVNKMMEEQMPIDRASLQQMARIVNANGSIDVQTLVQMQKLGIPLSPENAAQFENYLNDRQAITNELMNLIDTLPSVMGEEGLPVEGLKQQNAGILSVVTEGMETVAGEGAQSAEMTGTDTNALVLNTVSNEGQMQGENPLLLAYNSAKEGVTTALGLENEIPLPAQGEVVTDANVVPNEVTDANVVLNEATDANAVPNEAATLEENVQNTASSIEAEVLTNTPLPEEAKQLAKQAEIKQTYAEHTLGAVLDENQMKELNLMLGKLVNTTKLGYTPDKPVMQLLNELKGLLQSDANLPKEAMTRLFSSKEFGAVLKDALMQQWTIKPEELTGSDKINKLYEKMSSKLTAMAEMVENTGKDASGFMQLANEVKNNVSFMNQINELYTYVQLPLKMSGQNASGELYVYTKKNALRDADKELSAFLHLDMEHLGPTDVSVKMLHKEVSTDFYLQDDRAYALLEQFLPTLQEALKKKGYNCNVSVVNEAKHVNFVEDFLKKEKPAAGQLHRYSFDMRA